MARPAAVALAAVLVTSLPGCSADPQPTPRADLLPSASPAPTGLARAEAERIAQSSLLVARDLPRYVGDAGTADDSGDVPPAAELEPCLRLEDRTTRIAAHGETVDFDRPRDLVRVSAESDVFRDVGAAQAELQVLRSRSARRCLKSVVTDIHLRQGVPRPRVTVLPLPVAGPKGAQASYGWSIRVEGTVGGRPFDFQVRRVGALVGAAVVSIETVEGTGSVSAAERSRLLGLLVKRAAAAQKQ